MAARGTTSKENITKAILQIFGGSFIDSDGKTIRIPTSCEGETVEIKVALTAAKDVIGGTPVNPEVTTTPQNLEVTAEELEQVKALIKELGL